MLLPRNKKSRYLMKKLESRLLVLKKRGKNTARNIKNTKNVEKNTTWVQMIFYPKSAVFQYNRENTAVHINGRSMRSKRNHLKASYSQRFLLISLITLILKKP